MSSGEDMPLADQRTTTPELPALAAVEVDGCHPRPRARLRLRTTHNATSFVFALSTIWNQVLKYVIIHGPQRFH